MNARRLLATAYVVLLGALSVMAAKIFIDTRKEYVELKLIEKANEAKLAEAQARLAEQKRILERLRTDPEFADKVIRQRMGYAKPGEVIFRFP